MLSAKSVIPECYIDSCLFNVLLGFVRRGVNHAKGNATVIKKMEDDFKDLFCVGIVDKDRRDLRVITTDFDLIPIKLVEDSFILYQHKSRDYHYLIQIVPAIEEWICRVAENLKITITEFDIPASTTKELCQITKRADKKEDPRFKALFQEFIKKSVIYQYQPILKLKQAVTLILEKNYGLNINDLKNV